MVAIIPRTPHINITAVYDNVFHIYLIQYFIFDINLGNLMNIKNIINPKQTTNRKHSNFAKQYAIVNPGSGALFKFDILIA
jgi:hypothetical protein